MHRLQEKIIYFLLTFSACYTQYSLESFEVVDSSFQKFENALIRTNMSIHKKMVRCMDDDLGKFLLSCKSYFPQGSFVISFDLEKRSYSLKDQYKYPFSIKAANSLCESKKNEKEVSFFDNMFLGYLLKQVVKLDSIKYEDDADYHCVLHGDSKKMIGYKKGSVSKQYMFLVWMLVKKYSPEKYGTYVDSLMNQVER